MGTSSGDSSLKEWMSGGVENRYSVSNINSYLVLNLNKEWSDLEAKVIQIIQTRRNNSQDSLCKDAKRELLNVSENDVKI